MISWDFKHIIFNMIALWFFGREIEYSLRPREYLAFFLLAIVVAGLVWVLGEMVVDQR